MSYPPAVSSSFEFPHLDNLYGAYFIGTCVSIILYGVSFHQFYRYLRLYTSDPKAIKSLVSAVMSLETLHVGLLIHTCYYYLVSSYDDVTLNKIQHSVISLQLVPILSSFITVVSQVFFARRVALIGWRYQVIVVLASLMLLGHVGFGMAMSIDAFKLDSLSGFDNHSNWLFPAALACSAGADLLLSGCIIAAVHRSRSAGHQKYHNENRFDVWLLYTLNSGLLTCIFNVAPMIAAALYPQTFIWAGMSFVGTRFYAITLLSVLNSRKLNISQGLQIFEVAAVHNNIIARANHLISVEQWNAPQIPDDAPPRINISVSAEIEVHKHDEDERSAYEHKSFSSLAT